MLGSRDCSGLRGGIWGRNIPLISTAYILLLAGRGHGLHRDELAMASRAVQGSGRVVVGKVYRK